MKGILSNLPMGVISACVQLIKKYSSTRHPLSKGINVYELFYFL
jgi:hypothetical protein